MVLDDDPYMYVHYLILNFVMTYMVFPLLYFSILKKCFPFLRFLFHHRLFSFHQPTVSVFFFFTLFTFLYSFTCDIVIISFNIISPPPSLLFPSTSLFYDNAGRLLHLITRFVSKSFTAGFQIQEFNYRLIN